MNICTEDQTTWQLITILVLQTIQLAISAITHGKVRISNDAPPSNKENR